MNLTLEQLVATKGGKYADSGATVTGTQATNYIFLVVNEDAVFTTLEDVDETDLVATWGISGKTLSKGMVLGTGTSKAFGEVTVASGSVLLIKG